MLELVVDNYVIETPIIDILKKLKSQLDNGKLKQYQLKGDNIRVTCPHHKDGKEDKPSCDIYIGESTKNVSYGDYHCFTCNAKGPFWRFVAECFDSSDDYAKNWLIENFGDKVIKRKINLLPIELNNKSSYNDYIDEKVLDTFQSWHPYLAKRKLTPEVCKRFEVKYDPKTECIVFAVRDEKGKLALLTRRSVKTKKFIIDANREKPVYLLYYLLQKGIKEAYICESQFNALTCWEHDLPGVALFGTGTTSQYEILNKSGIRIFHLMFDGDEAGDKAIERFKKNIRKDAFVDVIKLPRGKDVNDLSYEEFENLICSSR